MPQQRKRLRAPWFVPVFALAAASNFVAWAEPAHAQPPPPPPPPAGQPYAYPNPYPAHPPPHPYAYRRGYGPDVSRRGGQIEGVIGGSHCLPGRAECSYDALPFAGVTRGSVGGGVALGWRATRWALVGVMYRGGALRPDYEEARGLPDYQVGVQHSAFAFFRPIIPIWRFDLGLNLAPGYSRQIFYITEDDVDYTQGFAFMVGPTIDVFVARHVFIGFEADFIFNVHGDVCEQRGRERTCFEGRARRLSPVHQAIYGFHLGFTFAGD